MRNKSLEMLEFRSALIFFQKDGEKGAGDAGGRLSAPDPHVGAPRLFPGARYL